MHEDINSRLASIKSKIKEACIKASRLNQSVELIAVSKLQSVETIKEAHKLGVKNFGENYAQELGKKNLACPKDIIWHFIGPIQSNKIALIAKHANWVHSIDRVKVARKLNEALKAEERKMHVLIQVNVDREESKSGIFPEDVISFAQDIRADYPNLILEGLMFMPNINASKKDKLNTMENIQSIQNALINELPDCGHLSLGTSGDFEESIAAGSTMVRIGEMLLGKRS